MASRLKLHEEFCEILGNRNVYFNPPETLKMSYPCIRYSCADPDQIYANDKTYRKMNEYEGVIIDYDPDSIIPDKTLEHFSMCKASKPYRADNLNHFPFTLYY